MCLVLQNGARALLFTSRWGLHDAEVMFADSLHFLRQGVHGAIVEFFAWPDFKESFDISELYRKYVGLGEHVRVYIKWKYKRNFGNYHCRIFIEYLQPLECQDCEICTA